MVKQIPKAACSYCHAQLHWGTRTTNDMRWKKGDVLCSSCSHRLSSLKGTPFEGDLSGAEKAVLTRYFSREPDWQTAKLLKVGLSFVRSCRIKRGLPANKKGRMVIKSAFQEFYGMIEGFHVAILNCLCAASCPMTIEQIEAVIGQWSQSHKVYMLPLIKLDLVSKFGRITNSEGHGPMVYAATEKAIHLFQKSLNGFDS